MLIEIAGVDGSGKSTLINQLIGWANRHGIVAYDWCVRSTTRRTVKSVSLLENPEFAAKLSGSILEFAVCTELMAVVNHAPASRLPGQLVFVDNYIHGWLTNVAQSEASILPEVATLLRHTVKPPELAFEIEVSPQQSYERIMQRTKLDPAFQLGGIRYVSNRIRAFQVTRAECNYPICIIDGTKKPEVIFQDVLKMIMSAAREKDPSLWKTINDIDLTLDS